MIKNVVLDLGGVVIDLAKERCIEAFKALGYTDIEAMLDLYVQSGPFFELETGAMSTAAFYDLMRPLCPAAGCDMDIQQAFNSFLVALPVERLRAIRRARRVGLKMFALSNTNPVMYPTWIDAAFRQEGLAIGDYFHGIIASFQERCCKPSPKIFEILLTRYGLQANETLFMDDSPANCEAARACGLQAVCITPANPMTKELQTLINQHETSA